MANNTLLTTILGALSSSSFEAACISQLNDSSYDWTGLVDHAGHSISGLSEKTWGIDVATCYRYCGDITFIKTFEFRDFSAAATNYFLPWLALTAQLVFETGDIWNNLMSFCLALGSPALVTYSLTITILNRYSIRRQFADLAARARAVATSIGNTEYADRIRAALFVLTQAQQVPLRVSHENGWLNSLLALPQNRDWWMQLEDRLKSEQRGFTASLVAQVFVAAVAYLFTVISSFVSELGDIPTGRQIASGSVWIWLIPVVLGWVTVGTQYRDDSVERAFMAFPAHRVAGPDSDIKDCLAQQKTIKEKQKGFMVASGLTPRTRGYSRKTKVLSPTWCTASVEGCGRHKGPIFNYARVFTWWQVSSTVYDGMRDVIEAMERSKANGGFRTTETKHEDAQDTERTRCVSDRNIHTTPFIRAFPPWSSMDEGVYHRIIAASIAAIILQWGTSGASILIGYTTPTVGLGCRSGSYLLYGSAGTLTWMLLLTSSLLSHHAMLRYQFQISHGLRAEVHPLVGGAAVITRYLGKSLAILNTIWLIMSSIFELVGGYSNCWCTGDVLNYGSSGWVTLFKTAHDLNMTSRPPWAAGLTMMFFVMISYIFFAVWNMGGDDE